MTVRWRRFGGLPLVFLAAFHLLPHHGAVLKNLDRAAPPTGLPPAKVLGDPPGCEWPEVDDGRLLDQPLGPVAFTATRVAEIVRSLIHQHHVPLSFIETDPEAKLTLNSRAVTVRQVLDAIVASVPRYRYRFIASRLVLYPQDSQWTATRQLDDLRIGPGPRRDVGTELVVELRRRLPALSRDDLRPPWVFGNPESFVYQDQVMLTGPASILELFVQLLGKRASAVFTVNAIKGVAGVPLWLSTADLVQSLDLTPSTTTLTRHDQTVQLKLVGMLYDGRQKNLTAGSCGTEYLVSDPKVIAVSPDGLVIARGQGVAVVSATNERLATATIKVANSRSKP